MKKIICAFFIMALSFTQFTCLDANLETKFKGKLATINIDDVWLLEDMDSDMISFEHADNRDVNFDLLQGKSVKSASLENLEKQFKKYIKGKAKSVPLLDDSLGFSPDESFRDDINPNIQRVILNGVEWLKVLSTNTLTVTYYTSQGPTEEVIPLNEYFYFSVVEKKIIGALFSTPTQEKDIYEPIFEKTVLELFN